MAQGEFTKEEADNAIECVKVLLNKVPKTKRADVLGEANDIFLFLETAKRNAPEGKKEKS